MSKKRIALIAAMTAFLSTGCTLNVTPGQSSSNSSKESDDLLGINSETKGDNSEDGNSGITVGQEGKSKKTSAQSSDNIRHQAIEKAYYKHYFQKTVYDSYQNIIRELEPLSVHLNEIFNFKRLMYDNKMLPPVIEESQGYVGVQGDKSMVRMKKRWRIIKEAKVVATPPVWQEYLFDGIKEKPNSINDFLTPENAEEEKVAAIGKQKGISEGISYVKTIFGINVSRLKKDYVGMMTFKKLEVQGVVRSPVLAQSKESFVYSDDNKEVSIGTERYLITKQSDFKNYEQWKPLVSKGIKLKLEDKVFSPPNHEQLKEVSQ